MRGQSLSSFFKDNPCFQIQSLSITCYGCFQNVTRVLDWRYRICRCINRTPTFYLAKKKPKKLKTKNRDIIISDGHKYRSNLALFVVKKLSDDRLFRVGHKYRSSVRLSPKKLYDERLYSVRHEYRLNFGPFVTNKIIQRSSFLCLTLNTDWIWVHLLLKNISDKRLFSVGHEYRLNFGLFVTKIKKFIRRLSF